MPFILQRILPTKTGADPADPTLTRSAAFQVLKTDLLRIGRGTNAGLHLKDNAVALEHAVVREEAGEYRLEERESITGTWRNGRRLRAEVPERLQDGDEIEIGPYRLRIQQASATDPLLILVERIPGGKGVGPPPIDYVRAYRLRRGVLNKGFLSVALLAAVLVAAAAVPLLNRNDAFQPGELSQIHRNSRPPGSDLSLREMNNNCAHCHDPWGGVASERCLDCHTAYDGQEAHAVLPAALSVGTGATSGCAGCHSEHRGRERIRVENADCVACHGNPAVLTGSPFTRTVTGIGEGRHPNLSLWLAVEGEAQRVQLTQAIDEQLDPGRLRFNHARHLAEEGLRVRGEVFYPACSDCHQRVEGGEDEGRMRPVNFELHCRSCHPLTFDPTFPREQAEHGDSRLVEDSLWGVYWRAGGGQPLVGGVSRQRGRLASQVGSSRLQKSVTEKARRAAYRLFRAECSKCHLLDLDAEPVTVEPPGIVETWFPHADFLHHEPHIGDRGDAACVDCHAAAEAGRDTGDVLLPEINTCTDAGCHGGDGAQRRAAAEIVTSDCRMCHGYHGSTARAQTPLTPLAVAATLEEFYRVQDSPSPGSTP